MLQATATCRKLGSVERCAVFYVRRGTLEQISNWALFVASIMPLDQITDLGPYSPKEMVDNEKKKKIKSNRRV